MVKFQICWIKKRYLRNKRVYKYRVILVKVPRKFHEVIEPFLSKKFEMKLTAQETAEEEIINIVLTRNKRYSADRN